MAESPPGQGFAKDFTPERKNRMRGDLSCRQRQRQALLHRAHDFWEL